jgi:hypothetical protein
MQDFSVCGGITTLQRDYLSYSHLCAAKLFAEKVSELEKIKDPTGPNRLEHRSCALSAVILSVAYLESAINELFCDCADGVGRVTGLHSAEQLGISWRKGIPRTAKYEVVEKYNIALELSNVAQMGSSDKTVQNAEILCKLRNGLIHAEASTNVSFSSYADEQKKTHKLSRQLAGKFPRSAYFGEGNPWFPDHALGSGGANWAVKSAQNFTQMFFEKLGFRPYE